ncbi:LysR substrate-binding domain-containing protein [Roseateles sp. BYS78W]|uniref:LysR substrate-binding domain-containing protein n=1 Tax=Pelomonas candidula TaxID=3299025 RepID=A0ABW7H8J6_9BURK
MDRLVATRVFVSVVEHGSLTQAAESLDMSTAMVSRYLAAIEAWLGTRLLHRTTRRISLTEAGQAALAGCRQLLDLAEDVEHQAGEVGRTPSGRLRIASSPSFAEAQLAPALVEFQRQHPEVGFSLVVTDRSIDLAAERIDLAVRITNSLEPTMIARPLASCRSVLCAAPAYLHAHGQPRTVKALQSHRCLTHATVGAAQFRFRQRRQLIELPVTEGLSTNDTGVLRRAVIEGGGIGILPTYLVGEDLKCGRLVRVLPTVEPETLGIHAIFLSRQHQPLALRLLVEFLVERFGGDLPPWDR